LGKFGNYCGVTATRHYIFGCTTVISTRKALQRAIFMLYVIMLPVPHKQLASHTKINYDIIRVGLSRRVLLIWYCYRVLLLEVIVSVFLRNVLPEHSTVTLQEEVTCSSEM
jgi:uncharacterized membrane protein